MTNSQPPGAARIDYTNWKGARAIRTIVPKAFEFGTSAFHADEADQWFVIAWDLDRNVERMFAMKNIHSWRPANE